MGGTAGGLPATPLRSFQGLRRSTCSAAPALVARAGVRGVPNPRGCRAQPCGHRGTATAAANVGAGFLFLLLNQPRLFAAIEQFTGAGEDVRCFLGRYYEAVPNREHYTNAFHSDANHHRLFGLSINLSERPVAGGAFEIRHRSAEGIPHTIAAWEFGDAILFRISRSLQHRIRPVTGTVARCCYAGWFVAEPDYRDLARLISPRPVPAARA